MPDMYKIVMNSDNWKDSKSTYVDNNDALTIQWTNGSTHYENNTKCTNIPHLLAQRNSHENV
jgi:hypothetical protein